jgi:hypothetical protein
MNARESENYLPISRSSMHQNSGDIFRPRYVGDDFFRIETSLVQSNSRSLRDLKSYICNFRCAEKKILVSMSEEI